MSHDGPSERMREYSKIVQKFGVFLRVAQIWRGFAWARVKKMGNGVLYPDFWIFGFLDTFKMPFVLKLRSLLNPLPGRYTRRPTSS